MRGERRTGFPEKLAREDTGDKDKGKGKELMPLLMIGGGIITQRGKKDHSKVVKNTIA